MSIKIEKRVLILFAHPAFQRSRINKKMMQGLDEIPGITVNDLYEQYPTLFIDIAREQNLLEKHDVIIMHHPFYWYSTPAILKEWQDLVLAHGWAYGRQGRALSGKYMLNVVTTGGPEPAYSAEGYNRFSLRQLLAPLEQTAFLCKMTYLAPFVVHGTHLMKPELIAQHASDYHKFLKALVANEVNLEKAAQVDRVNKDLASLMKGN
jgi:glutathione-regulated potassium-efflux system ancillary protein KefG